MTANVLDKDRHSGDTKNTVIDTTSSAHMPMINATKHSIFDGNALEVFRKKYNLQPFRMKQIFHEIFKNSVLDFQEMTTLSKDLRDNLSAEYEIIPFTIKELHEGNDTTKFLFSLPDGNVIESVVMFHFHEIIE